MLTTLERAKTMLGVSLEDTGQDEQLLMLLGVASAAIEARCRRTFGRQVHVQEVDRTSGQYLFLRNYPVHSVTEVLEDEKEIKGFKVVKEKGMLSRSVWPCGLTVEYEAGYTLPGDETQDRPANLPKELEYACILFVQYAQRNPGVKSERVGDISVTYGDDGADIPAPIMALINPYVSRCL